MKWLNRGCFLFFSAACVSIGILSSCIKDGNNTVFEKTKTEQNCKPLAYIGTYTQGNSEGIYKYNYKVEPETLLSYGLAAKLTNPSYLAIDHKNNYLYSVTETDRSEGENGGAVAAFSIDRQTGQLTYLNSQQTQGKSLCHITLDRANTYAFVSNYSDGTLTVFPIKSDGSLAPCCSLITHQGHGADKSRQAAPHVHFSQLTPDEKYLCVVDLGIDKVMVYDFDKNDGSLTYNDNLTIHLKPGSGPRHLVFGKNGNYVYIVTELSSEIAVYEYCPSECKFKEIQYISTLPADYHDQSYSSAIRISPNGKFLYASNRGHDSIATYRIDEASGKIALVSHTPTGGDWPRDFNIDPTGNYLFVANQNSHTIVPFVIDPRNGTLKQTSSTIHIENPACIQFMVPGD